MTEQLDLDLPPVEPTPVADQNHEFVARGVAYVRRMLADGLPAATSSEARPQRSFGRSWSAPQPADEPIASDAQDPSYDADPLAFDGPSPALVTLGERFGLNRFERDIVLLGTAVELDPSLRDLCARLHGNPAMRYPTFAIAMMVLPDPLWTALSPDGPLRAHRLIDVETATGEPLVTAALAVDERLVNHIRGHDHLDARLRASVLSMDEVDIDSLPVSQRASADRVVARWTGHTDDAPYVQRLGVDRPVLTPDPVVVELVGSDTRTAALLAGAIVDRFGLVCYRMSASSLPSDEAQLDELARLWRREAGLSPVAVFLEDADSHPHATGFARRSGCACFLQLSQPPMLPGPASLRIDVAPPTTEERHAAWVAHLPADSPADPGQLAAQFAVDTATIARLAAGTEDPWEQARQEARPRLEGLAERIAPQASWPDLVLDEDKTTLLHAIADQVRHRWQVYHEWELADRATRGTGIAVLFAGPSGTGKTLAAEVLANDIGLDLYKADLAGIVSKYIGETEKNLRQLFDAAEAGGGVLFIDEADALFGKRSEVKDSHDRFANTQINYLLQRMESYRGVAILATNMRSALDTAFLRRLRFIVEFPFPEVAQRAAIWRASLPSELPGAQDLDVDRLAELPVNGGMIRNISVNAAFLAAAAGTELSTENVLQAVRNEFAKLQVPISERQLTGRQLTR